MTLLIKAKRQQQQQQPAQLQQANNMTTLSDAEMICNNAQLKNMNKKKKLKLKQLQNKKNCYNNNAACNMFNNNAATTQTSTITTTTTSATMTTNLSGCCCHSEMQSSNQQQQQFQCDNNCSGNSNNNNYNNTVHKLLQWLFITTLLLGVFCDATHAALTNVNLLIEPPAVRRGQSVALRCDYRLEGAPLYSIKFYRGQYEFYRYTPGEYPNTKVFPYPSIRVDDAASNATQVVLRNVSFSQSGNFSCEVTADAPLYVTAMAYAQMQVVEFPEKRPQLFTEHTRYEPGDVLRANCSTPPSRPRAELRFSINNIPVNSEETQYIRTVDNTIASRLSLKVQLQAVHFATASSVHGNNALNAGVGSGNGNGIAVGGALILRCTAQIGDLYQEYKEIELGTPQKDPVPARVTLSSGSGIRNFFETYFATSAAMTTFTANRHSWLLIWFLALSLTGLSLSSPLKIAFQNNVQSASADIR